MRKGLKGAPLYFYLKEGSDIIAGLPGVLLSFKVLKILYASIPYGNLIGEKSYFSLLMELLEKEFRRRGIDQVRMTESPFSESYQPNTFQSISAKCSLLDLRRFQKEKIWENYRSEVRRAIRKAQKNELFVKKTTSLKEMESFYQLYLSSMKRNRSAAKYPRQWFNALYEILIQKRKSDILFAMKGDRYAAGVVLIYSTTSNHYLHNGSDQTHLENRPNDLIVDQIIQESLKEGKTTLDFMGSDSNDLPLIRFKEKWGSRSVDLHTYVKDYHPLRCRMWEVSKRVARTRIGLRLSGLIRN